MSIEQRALRNRLRAHGRQLGDQRDERRGTQSIGRLVGECAYEHWHRMLFARFLAENELLIQPEHELPISLADCEELARAQGLDWLQLASSYAVRMLPQIFRPDDPVLEVNLPPETRSELEDLLKVLPRDVFLADDSLGWVYQFWQAEQKDAINKSEKKIGADELPAVTQLFTEDYMVEFLLHNTLGAWWAGKVLAANPELAENAKDEEELRAACAVGDVQWTYLRFLREEGKEWRTAAGAFEGWPRAAKDITMLDPCMGSGHFLVFGLPILVALRMVEEGLSNEAAVQAVLQDNLFGLEIDQRCTQIAAFNLALAAWRRVGYHPLPQLNLACSGLAIGVTKSEWLNLAEEVAAASGLPVDRDLLGAEDNLFSQRIKAGLEALYDLFAQAPTLGSLIEPRRAGGDLLEAGFAELEPLLATLFSRAQDDDILEMAVAAQGMATAAELMARRFTLVVTNVPYLARGKQDPKLRDFAEQYYADAKQDLATIFLRRCLQFLGGGTVAAVTPQNWLFLTSYKKLREGLLQEQTFNVVAKLGEHGFESVQAAGAFTALCILSQVPPDKEHTFAGLDVSAPKSAVEKAAGLGEEQCDFADQSTQLLNPDARVAFKSMEGLKLLSQYSSAYQGVSPADYPHYGRTFWEVDLNEQCVRWQASVEYGHHYGGRHQILWKNADFMRALQLGSAYWRGNDSIGNLGVVVSAMRELPVTLSEGQPNDTNVAVVVPHNPAHLPAIWCFCSSLDYAQAVRRIDQKLNVTNATLVKVPFDLDHWQRVAAEQYPHGLPEPYSDDSTQWIFHGHPCVSVQWNEETKRLEVSSTPRTDATVLQVAVARLSGYRWPAEVDAEMRLSDESRAVMARCAELHRFEDADGIVCLSPIRKEPPAAQRLTDLLAVAYGEHWSAARLNELLVAAAECRGKTLHDWLRDKFFEQHCSLFHHRPFIWHIWDGLRDGFNALVNYHKLAAPNGEGRRTLEKLIYTYLGDWIAQQRRDQQAEVEGADARVAAAMHLQSELKKILEGQPPYDLFIRWKPLYEQPIGWDPDINDGVRLNIRPFMTARPLNARAKNACILRTTPKIKWDKDRGKEPERPKEDYPWFWGWDEKTQDFPGGKTFDGHRWNALHYTNDFKRKAREFR